MQTDTKEFWYFMQPNFAYFISSKGYAEYITVLLC